MIGRILFWWFLLTLGVVSAAVAQPERAAFVRLGLAEGMSHHTVGALMQDHQGFMWVGTQDGLNRFDGYRFRAFRTGEAGLGNAYIRALAEDAAGRIWIGTDYGLVYFDPRTERFTSYRPHREQADGLPDARINALIVVGDELLIGTQRAGLCRLNLASPRNLNPKQARFERERTGGPDGAPDSAIQELIHATAGRVWVGMGTNGLARFDLRTHRFEAFASPVNGRFHVWDLWQADEHTLWIAAAQGLYRLDPAKKAMVRSLREGAPPAYAVCVDKAGNLWYMLAQEGLYCRPANGGPERHYLNDGADPASLTTNAGVHLALDRAGSVWAGLDGGGVCRYDAARQPLREYTAGNGRAFRPGEAVRAFAEDAKGNLWLAAAASGKLIYLDPRTGAARRMMIPHGPGESDLDLGSNTARMDAQGRLWLSTIGAGPLCYDPATEQWRRLRPLLDQQGIDGKSMVTGFDFDAQGRIWFGTSAMGVICWDDATGKATRYGQGVNGLATNNILGLAVDRRTGQVWVGTWGGGLHRIEPQTGRVIRYPLDPDEKGALPAVAVLDILPDLHGSGMWVGTASGLFRTESPNGPFRRIRGLTANIIYTMARDPKGRVWIGSDRNFASIAGPDAPVRNYEFASPALYSYGGIACTSAGQVLVCTQEGMIGFFPDQLLADLTPPPVVLTGVEVLNRPVAPGQQLAGDETAPLAAAPAYAERLLLAPEQNVFAINYTSLSFPQAERMQYAYRLVGFADDWVEAGAKRTAAYTNLPPGQYTFEVKARPPDGVWSQTPARLIVEVLPPWWRTWWAYALYVVLVAAGILVAARLWLSRQRNLLQLSLKETEAARLAELDQIKTRFFTNISHEFRTPLTLILGPLEKWRSQPASDEKRRREEDAMRRNARRLLELINQLLDIAKLEAGSLQLDATPHDLTQLARALTFSFASLAETRSVALTFEAEADLAAVPLDGDKFEKILTNLLSNALKFTPAGGKVRVSIGRSADRAIVRVSDTGVGIPADRLPFVFDRFYQIDNSPTREFEGTGIGLALVKELVQLHGGTVTVTSTEGMGTIFTVELPAVPISGAVVQQPVISETIKTETPEVAIAAAAAVPSKTKATRPDDDTKPVVLIVEDHPDVRQYIHDQFGPDYRVLEAVDGQYGLAVAQEQVPDLIITDLMMPRLDGVELTRRLKTDERTSHIPVILLTAKASVESRLEGLETGADDYLTKPFQPLELVTRVRNLIEQRRRLREKYSREIREVREVKLNVSEVKVLSADERFLQKALGVVEAKMADEAFDVEEFAGAMAMSRVQLYRKLKALTDQTPTDFIRTLRLRRAAQLLDQQMGNVAEVAYAVGFQNLSYFSKTFKELHGLTPSEWADRQDKAAPDAATVDT